MTKYDNRGNSKNKRFLKIEHWIMKSEAWKSLTAQEVRIYLLLIERYNGANNGRIGLSVRQAAKNGHVSPTTAAKALLSLTEKGFIVKRFCGSFSQKTPLASEYELTHERYGDKPPTKEFMKWRPEKIMVTKQANDSIKLDAVDKYQTL